MHDHDLGSYISYVLLKVINAKYLFELLIQFLYNSINRNECHELYSGSAVYIWDTDTDSLYLNNEESRSSMCKYLLIQKNKG